MQIEFRKLINIIDHQLKQTNTASVYSVVDNGRIATQNQIAMWTNMRLNSFATINSLFWEKVSEYTVPNDTDILELPIFFKYVRGLYINNCFYKIGKFGDFRARYVTLDDHRIKCNYITGFKQNDVIYIDGVFKPEMIKEDCTTEAEREDALNSVVDMPDSYINLLVYGICLDFAAREKENFPQMFHEYNQILKRFQNDSPPAQRIGRFTTAMPFGKGRMIRV